MRHCYSIVLTLGLGIAGAADARAGPSEEDPTAAVRREIEANDIDAALLALESASSKKADVPVSELVREVALAELRALFDDAPPEIQADAWAGLRCADPATAARLLPELAGMDWERVPRGAARVRDLLSFDDAGLKPTFRRLAASTRPELAAIGNAGLARSGETAALGAVKALIASPDADAAGAARDAAARAGLRSTLDALRGRTKGQDANRLEALATIVRLTPDARERRSAIRLIRQHAQAAPSQSARGLVPAIASLGSLSSLDDMARRALLTIARSAPTAERRRTAELALARAGEAAVAPSLLARIRGAEAQGAMAEAKALGRLGIREFHPDLRELLSDPRTTVHEGASIAFAHSGGAREAAGELARSLRGARARRAFEVRLELAFGLLRVDPEMPVLPVLTVELERGASREENAARCADAVERLYRALAPLATRMAIETPEPDLIVVAVDPRLDRRRLAAEARKALESAGYAFGLVEADSAAASSSTAAGATGLSP